MTEKELLVFNERRDCQQFVNPSALSDSKTCINWYGHVVIQTCVPLALLEYKIRELIAGAPDPLSTDCSSDSSAVVRLRKYRPRNRISLTSQADQHRNSFNTPYQQVLALETEKTTSELTIPSREASFSPLTSC
jgi:hypothetical protein